MANAKRIKRGKRTDQEAFQLLPDQGKPARLVGIQFGIEGGAKVIVNGPGRPWTVENALQLLGVEPQP